MLLRSEYRCELLWVRHGFRRGRPGLTTVPYPTYLDVRCRVVLALVVLGIESS